MLAGWTLVNALGMAGVTRAYQARWEIDQRQLAALQAVVPVLSPVSPVWLWPVAVDRHSLDVPNAGVLDGYFLSVYEISRTAKGAAQMLDLRRDVEVIARDFNDTWDVAVVETAPDGTVTTLRVRGQRVPVAHLVAFACLWRALDFAQPFTYPRWRCDGRSALAVSRGGCPPWRAGRAVHPYVAIHSVKVLRGKAFCDRRILCAQAPGKPSVGYKQVGNLHFC